MAKKFSQTIRHGAIQLRKRASTGIWQAKFKVPYQGGVWRERSLGTTLKSEAIKAAEILSSQLLNQNWGVADGSIKLDELLSIYFDEICRRLRPESVKTLRSSVKNFRDWLDASGHRVGPVRQVTPAMISQFQQWRHAQGTSPRTIDKDVSNLHTIFSWAIAQGMLGASPADYSRRGPINLFKAVGNNTDVYSEDEVRRLIAAAGDAKDILIRDMIVVLSATGMRFEELAHLSAVSLSEHAGVSFVTIKQYDLTIKGKKVRFRPKDAKEVKDIPLAPEAAAVLKRRAAEHKTGPLFRNSANNKVAANKTRERLQRLFPKVGIDSDRRLHWHSFRRYFVKRCVEAGVPLNVLMSWTGHDSVQMALFYAPSKRQDSIRELNRLLSA